MIEPRFYRLPLPPSANDYWQFGALRSRTGRARRVPLTTKAANFRQDVAYEVFHQNGNKLLQPLVGYVRLECRIVWPDQRRRDSGNLSKQLEDALEKSGVVVNDVWIIDRRYWVDLTELMAGTGYVDITLSVIGQPAVKPPRPARRVTRKAVPDAR